MAANAQSSAPLVARTSAPDWVLVDKLPDFPSERLDEVADGLAYILSDRQKKWQPGGFEVYSHIAYQIVQRSALEEAAKIDLSFDPKTDTLALSRLHIIRNGEIIDRLETATIDVIRREEELSSNIMDGAYTALIQLRDVRVGDIIEYAYHSRVLTPLWPEANFGYVSLEWSVPLARQTSRILTPSDYPIRFQKIEVDVDIAETERDGWIEYVIDSNNRDPIPNESNVPYDHVSHGYLAYSTLETWAQAANLGVEIFNVDQSLPQAFARRLDDIARKQKSKEAQIVSVLRIVQDEVRYLGFEGGIGGHRPRTPRETIANAYGDCKDKSLLLVAALHHLGIDAVPVLAHTTDGWTINKEPPGIAAFNHAIVRARLNGRDIWLDPTLSYQGGDLDHLAPLDYGYVLPLRKDVSDLSLVSAPFPDQPTIKSTETYTFLPEGEDGMELAVVTEFHSYDADNLRLRIANNGKAKLGDEYLDYYDPMYPGLRMTGPLIVTDDLATNTITVEEAYLLSRTDLEAAKDSSALPLRANYVLDILPETLERDRRAPLRMPYGTSQEHIIHVHTPGLDLNMPDDVSLTAPGVRYTETYEENGESVSAFFRIDVDARSVPPELAQDVIDLEEEIDNSAYMDLTLNEKEPSPLVQFFKLLTTPAETD